MDSGTAIRLAAASLATRTAFTADTCEWASAELAIALGLTRASGPSAAARQPPPTVPATVLTEPAGQRGSDTNHNAPAVQVPAGPRRRARLLLVTGVAVLAVAIAAGAAYYSQPSSPAAGSRRPVTQCARPALIKALVAGNPQLKSLSWTLTSYACGSSWAVATLNAPSVGFGIAFLRRTASGWWSDPLSGGAGFCTSHGALGTPALPSALTVSLLRKVGFPCKTVP